MGICGFASVDWVTADFANNYSGKSKPCTFYPQRVHGVPQPPV